MSLLIKRPMNGRSSFSPGPDHLHHRLLAAGFTQQQAVVGLYCASILIGCVGLLGYFSNASEGLMFLGFVLMFTAYMMVPDRVIRKASRELQAVSAGLAWLALSNAGGGQIVLWIGVGMCVGLLAALWVWTSLRDQRRLGEAQRSERMAKGVAELHAKLARQRAEDAAKLRALTERATETRPNWLKTGFVAGGALGLGVALVLTQFVALGLVAVAFTGGGVAGYVVRGRLHRRAADRSGAPISVGASSQGVVELPRARSRGLGLRLLKRRAA